MAIEGVNNPDYQSEINPYRLPSLIWELVTPYMKKYGVQFSEQAPRTQVTQPVITWRILRRIPGTREGGKSTGASFAYRKIPTHQNFNPQVFQADYRVWLEYSVYGNSSTEIDDIAWDLENAIQQSISAIMDRIPGFNMVFSEQFSDELVRSTPVELSVRRLVFEAQLPVHYTRNVRRLRDLQTEILAGRAIYTDTAFTRTTTDIVYNVPVSSWKYVVQIWMVTLTRNNEVIRLVPGTDYIVKIDDHHPRVYISWLDDNGLTPAVGEEFRVSYSVSTSFMVDTTHYQRQE